MTIKLLPNSEVLSKLLKREQFSIHVKCNDLDHAGYIIISEYMLGVLTTHLDYIKIDEMLFAVDEGNLLMSIMFIKQEDGYQSYTMNTNEYNEIERLLQ